MNCVLTSPNPISKPIDEKWESHCSLSSSPLPNIPKEAIGIMGVHSEHAAHSSILSGQHEDDEYHKEKKRGLVEGRTMSEKSVASTASMTSDSNEPSPRKKQSIAKDSSFQSVRLPSLASFRTHDTDDYGSISLRDANENEEDEDLKPKAGKRITPVVRTKSDCSEVSQDSTMDDIDGPGPKSSRSIKAETKGNMMQQDEEAQKREEADGLIVSDPDMRARDRTPRRSSRIEGAPRRSRSKEGRRDSSTKDASRRSSSREGRRRSSSKDGGRRSSTIEHGNNSSRSSDHIKDSQDCLGTPLRRSSSKDRARRSSSREGRRAHTQQEQESSRASLRRTFNSSSKDGTYQRSTSREGRRRSSSKDSRRSISNEPANDSFPPGAGHLQPVQESLRAIEVNSMESQNRKDGPWSSTQQLWNNSFRSSDQMKDVQDCLATHLSRSSCNDRAQPSSISEGRRSSSSNGSLCPSTKEPEKDSAPRSAEQIQDVQGCQRTPLRRTSRRDGVPQRSTSREGRRRSNSKDGRRTSTGELGGDSLAHSSEHIQDAQNPARNTLRRTYSLSSNDGSHQSSRSLEGRRRSSSKDAHRSSSDNTQEEQKSSRAPLRRTLSSRSNDGARQPSTSREGRRHSSSKDGRRSSSNELATDSFPPCLGHLQPVQENLNAIDVNSMESQNRKEAINPPSGTSKTFDSENSAFSFFDDEALKVSDSESCEISQEKKTNSKKDADSRSKEGRIDSSTKDASRRSSSREGRRRSSSKDGRRSSTKELWNNSSRSSDHIKDSQDCLETPLSHSNSKDRARRSSSREGRRSSSSNDGRWPSTKELEKDSAPCSSDQIQDVQGCQRTPLRRTSSRDGATRRSTSREGRRRSNSKDGRRTSTGELAGDFLAHSSEQIQDAQDSARMTPRRTGSLSSKDGAHQPSRTRGARQRSRSTEGRRRSSSKDGRRSSSNESANDSFPPGLGHLQPVQENLSSIEANSMESQNRKEANNPPPETSKTFDSEDSAFSFFDDEALKVSDSEGCGVSQEKKSNSKKDAKSQRSSSRSLANPDESTKPRHVRRHSGPIDAQTANVQVNNVKALARNKTNQDATTSKGGSFLGIADDLENTKDLPRENLSSRNLGTPDDSSLRIQKSKGNDKTENTPFGSLENGKAFNESATEESNSMRQLQQTSNESKDIFNQEMAAREKRKSNTSLHASLHFDYTPNIISSRRSLFERAKSDHFLNVTQKNESDMSLMSPIRDISPKGPRPQFQSTANPEETAVENKTQSKDKTQKKRKKSKKKDTEATAGSPNGIVKEPKAIDVKSTDLPNRNDTVSPPPETNVGTAETKSAALVPRRGLKSLAKFESILNFASDDWEGATRTTSVELDPDKAESLTVKRKMDVSRSKSKPIDAQTANVQVNNVEALARNKPNQDATTSKQGRTAAPRWGSSAMEKAASLFNFGIENWESDSDSSAPDGGNQADAVVVERKSDSAKPKSKKKVKNSKKVKALAHNETNQEATKPNLERTASLLWRSCAMEENFNFSIEDWDSDQDSNAPDGGNEADSFVVEQKGDIAKTKSEKKAKNTKLPGKLSKILDSKESNQKPASRQARRPRRTKSITSEDSSVGNSIKKSASRRIKFIPKSEIEQEHHT